MRQVEEKVKSKLAFYVLTNLGEKEVILHATKDGRHYRRGSRPQIPI